MTQPPGGYPPSEPGGPHPPPADPFYAPPSWEPPGTQSYPPPPPPTSPPPGPPSPGSWPPESSPGSSPPGSPPPPPTSPYGPPGSPYLPPGATVPMSAVPGSPPASPYGPPGGPPYGPPGSGSAYPPPGPPPRRRRGLLIGLIALAGVLVLSIGGGLTAWLLTRDPDRDGATSPTAAVESFLQAVYRNQDAEQAAGLVCSEARDQAALQTKIDELKAYQGTQVSPTFEWTEPAVVEEREELAVVQVTVTMTTGDEKTANQHLQVSVLDKQDNGWWVCDLTAVDSATTPPPGDESGTPAPSETPSESGG